MERGSFTPRVGWSQVDTTLWVYKHMATETFPCFPVSWHKGSSQILHSILPASVSLKSLPMPRSFTLCILFGDQQTSDPRLQDFCKSGYKTLHLSKCVLGRLSIIQLQRSGGTFPLRAQTPTKDELHGQASASSSLCQHPLLFTPSWHPGLLGERKRGSMDHSSHVLGSQSAAWHMQG